MIWNEEKDELLCREILVVNVFCGTKRSTVARGAKWENVAENLNKLQDVYLKWIRGKFVTAITILQGI